jgi:hypothetical protein
MDEPTTAVVLPEEIQPFDIMNAIDGLRELVGGGGDGRHGFTY